MKSEDLSSGIRRTTFVYLSREICLATLKTRNSRDFCGTTVNRVASSLLSLVLLSSASPTISSQVLLRPAPTASLTRRRPTPTTTSVHLLSSCFIFNSSPTASPSDDFGSSSLHTSFSSSSSEF
ncbi:hypothetical protein Q3G72_004542 [Acer saccharum]|nr:hypothetical protein Q3G72_004542 [Acer saccharum]